jgi:hypothetical protein
MTRRAGLRAVERRCLAHVVMRRVVHVLAAQLTAVADVFFLPQRSTTNGKKGATLGEEVAGYGLLHVSSCLSAELCALAGSRQEHSGCSCVWYMSSCVAWQRHA